MLKNRINIQFEKLKKNNDSALVPYLTAGFPDRETFVDLSLKILKSSRYRSSKLNIGNFKLFELLINKLSMPQRWKSRLLKFYWNEKYFSELLYLQIFYSNFL